MSPFVERAEHYRRLAQDAISHANESTDHATREVYFNLARCWHALALQLEENAERSIPPPSIKPPLPRNRSFR